jgi:deazaflavin-dependent oxidoreductase (nitroreductase family)
MGRSARLLRRLTTFVIIAGAMLGAVFVVGMRAKSRGIQRAVRRMNKAVINPKTMATAGRPGASASVVHHVGRRSGTAYATPVASVATGDGFVIALPYGTRADWVRNALAAGRVTITHEGEDHEVDSPEVVPTAEVDALFGESDRSAHRAFKVDECLRLRHVGAAAGGAADPSAN